MHDTDQKKLTSSENIRKAVKLNFRYLLGTVCFSVLVAFLSSVNPILYEKIIDVIIPEKDVTKLIFYVILIAVIPLTNVAISSFRQRFGFLFSSNSYDYLTKIYFQAILKMEYVNYEKFSTSKLLNILTRNIGQICWVYFNTDIILGVTNIAQLIIIFVILCRYNLLVAISTFLVVPGLVILTHIMSKKIGRIQKEHLDHLAKGDSFLLEVFNGMKTVRSFNGTAFELEKWDEWLKKRAFLKWRIEKANISVRIFLPAAVSQIVLGGIFATCAYFVMNDRLSTGSLVAIISYVPSLINSIKYILSIDIGRAEISKIIDELDTIILPASEKKTECKPKISENIIDFKNVTFSYGREDFCLRIDNLEIKKGDFITIVGTTGSGKSAIMDIINLFYPITSGKVKILDNDIEQIDTDYTRSCFSYVSQNDFLFDGTIAENIAFPFDLDINKLNDVIIKSQLKEFVESLPSGTQTKIENNGNNLSGGERQRIAIARALYKSSDIIILDEPTAALDPITAKKIFEMLKNENIQNGKTIIIITHDVMKTDYSNKTVVVDEDGIVSQAESHKNLKLINKTFKRLLESQQTEMK